MRNRIQNRGSSKGFTLIEVLVAMLVIAIGVLGVAALQFQALKYNHDAYLRSQINVLANDIIDRIRINNANVADYAGNYVIGSTTPGCNETSAPAAANDLNCWRTAVNNALPPGGAANIAQVGTTEQYTVTLSWTSRDAAAATQVSYIFQP